MTGDPVVPSPGQSGTGLCVANSISTDPNVDFPESTSAFIGGLNDFMERTAASRVTYVLRAPFDLSNNHTNTPQASRGDFLDAIQGCPSYGCGFFINDTTTPFGSRFRGYLNVTPDMVGKVLHFGFYTDDAVSFTIFDKANTQYQVINRPPVRFQYTWRSTNNVTFLQSGLYPVEVLYAQGTDHAALEMSLFEGVFSDFEQTAATSASLRQADFLLVSPEKFFQTETGRPSGTPTAPQDLNQCAQCNRANANTPGNGGCGLNSGFYCNGAALCAPCDTSRVCGPSCSPCGASTPNCINVNGTFTCVECTVDGQCPNGRCDPSTNTCKGCNDDADCPQTGRCDTATNTCQGCNDDTDCPADQVCDVPNATCVECNRDEDCPPDEVCAPEFKECRECNQDSECERGKSCSNHQCVTCSTNDSCAGNSCNCCPGNTQCASPTPGASPSCVECTTDSQCLGGQKCDTINGRCVDTVPECNTSDRCGAECVKCPTERPFCLDGQVCVTCRNDLECGSGQFCLSGECASCTTDRHCGSRCEACEPATPFCLTDGTTAGSACVACRNNSDCGTGGQCNPATFTCTNPTGCEQNCAEQGLVCNGSACVQCFADAHCPCGGSCDLSTNTCTEQCEDSGDCLGVEYCSPLTQECERGRRKPGTSPQGGSFCCETTTADLTSTGTGAFLAMLLVGFLLLHSRRSL
ncbi:outer membrane exchange protein TraA family protein [Hyalangium sp. s54d21]|uniref:Outer membrane exchange protein TraA family protein n=1 Tax=Hyalangium rubrum TaxID=3103134 RepID=A0ABU5HFU0_9BACT|nr:outer membrane exchange protein TraA family protein [Hyalangium sp. s54d21]MDY7232341.1 outer membrane exchange protein TraA family protein [Hyalangium sp. s54d21]